MLLTKMFTQNAFPDNGPEEYFVLNAPGKNFEHVLKGLRLHHIINDAASLKVIENDKIIPQGKTLII